jgi:hypothetical protein
MESAYLESGPDRGFPAVPAALATTIRRAEELLRARSELESGRPGRFAGRGRYSRQAGFPQLPRIAWPDSHYRRGQIEETLEVLERWRQSHPHDPLPLARRGLVLHGLGEQDAAAIIRCKPRAWPTASARQAVVSGGALTLRQPGRWRSRSRSAACRRRASFSLPER